MKIETAAASKLLLSRMPGRGRSIPELAYPLLGLVLVAALLGLANHDFLSVDNLVTILRQVSINTIIAAGMTFVILTGGIDLSVGSVMALSGTLTAGLLVHGVSPVPAIAAGLASGLLAGVVNGLFVAWLGMPSIIVTLATMGIARGLALLYSGGYPIDGMPAWFGYLGRTAWLGLPLLVLLAGLIYLVGWIALRSTPFGRYAYAIGGNETATRLSGIPVRGYKWSVYVISGFTAAVAGLVLSSRLMSGQPGAGNGFELDAIAAVVMGGTAISGGRGSILGTALGAILLGTINSGLNMTGVSPYL